MTQNIAHRTWLVTGASSGIGLALTTAALERGDDVVGLARNLEPLKALVDAHPQQLVVAPADVRDQAQVDAAVAQGLERFGRIDVLVNNAGRGVFGGVEEVSADQVRAAFDTNVFGRLNVLRAVLPTLRAQRSGHVVQVSAYRGQSASPGMGLIAGFNHAIEGISDALADELAPLGVHVTIVEPGPSATSFSANFDRAGGIDDYDGTVRAAAKAIQALPPEVFNQAGPIAQAVLAAVDAEQPPRRLATGSVAVTAIRGALRSRLADLDAWEDVSTAVDTRPGNAA